MKRKLDALWLLAMDRVSTLGGDADELNAEVQERFAEEERAGGVGGRRRRGRRGEDDDGEVVD